MSDTLSNEFDSEEVLRNPISRRAFLARLQAAGLGAVAMTLMAGCGGSRVTSNGYSNPNFPNVPGRNVNEVVLNYALTLEILEADLYRQALNKATGVAIGSSLDTTIPQPGGLGNYKMNIPLGGLDTATANAGYLYLVQFAYAEATHRDFLFATLTGLGAPQAQANNNGYQFPASAINSVGDPGVDLKTILTNLLPVEETGVRAYLGALPYVTDVNTAQNAAAIYSTETRHSASLAVLLGSDPGPSSGIAGVPSNHTVGNQTYPHTNTFEYYSTPSEVLSALSTAYYIK